MNGGLRRNRALAAILGALFLLLVALTALNRDKAYPRADLHPENPDPNGARAVARVLEGLGVQVTVAHDQSELLDQRIDGDTTVMVTSTQFLGRSTATELQKVARRAGDIVVAQPPPGLLPGLEVANVDAQGRHGAACDDDLLRGLSLDVRPSPVYRLPGSTGCFPAGGGDLVVRSDNVYVVGGADLFSNHSVVRADNAAAALRLLGSHRSLVWYVPDPADLTAADGVALSDLIPPWALPGLIVVGGALVAVVLWRGRRLGPVVAEPLPVVVRSTEAVEARGRLYRRSRDREHAAQALRDGTIERLGAHFGLPSPSPGMLVPEVARATGLPVHEVGRLLLSGEPISDDESMVALANALHELETRVSHA